MKKRIPVARVKKAIRRLKKHPHPALLTKVKGAKAVNLRRVRKTAEMRLPRVLLVMRHHPKPQPYPR